MRNVKVRMDNEFEQLYYNAKSEEGQAMSRMPVIIDTDPGVDDALAIFLALAAPQLDVRLFSSVGGNVNLERTTRNLMVIQRFLGTKVPVARGAAGPLNPSRAASHAEEVHGVTGLGGWDFNQADSTLLANQGAVEAMREAILTSPSPTTILALGPLTNVASLLAQHPELASRLRGIVLMGGAIGRGNKTPYVEFNAGCDPEATHAVLHGPVPVTMVPLEVANSALFHQADFDAIGSTGRVGRAVCSLFLDGPYGSAQEGIPMYDPTAAAFLCKPDMFLADVHPVAVEVQGRLTAGATLVYDEPAPQEAHAANVRVCSGINAHEFLLWVLQTLRSWE